MSEKLLHTILLSSGKNYGLEPTEAKIRELIGKRFEGFSIFAGTGFWKGAAEPTFQILIATQDEWAIKAVIEELKGAFRQDSVVEIRHSAANVAFH